MPEAEALWFYGMNHGMALIAAKRAPLEPLSKWEQEFVTTYHVDDGEEGGARVLLSDLDLHPRGAPQPVAVGGPAQDRQVVRPGDAGVLHQHQGRRGRDRPRSSSTTRRRRRSASIARRSRWMFYHGKWSERLRRQEVGRRHRLSCAASSSGEFSAEMMLDTIWTLAHNGGPIFNKGQFYTTCTRQR